MAKRPKPKRGPGLRGLTTAAIRAELERRSRDDFDRQAAELRDRRDRLKSELAQAERDLARLLAARNRTQPKRGPGIADRVAAKKAGRPSLPDLLEDLLVLHGPMAVPEIAKAAKKAGYRPRTDNPSLEVNNTLRYNRSMFERVRWGVYGIKGTTSGW